MTLKELNALSASDAAPLFRQCCNASRWVAEMVTGRPYADIGALSAAAGRIFRSLTDEDWKEAFAGHPKIGDLNGLREKFPATAGMSEAEQSGLSRTSEKLLADLVTANERYQQKFGYIFIVCATGKRADEMLAILNDRFKNIPEAELRVAAREQEKITQLRLNNIVS
jgi:2-oxo-4-hydroxy-4-carboxy-5-ureidoimidazoline decarboxylase